MITLEQRREARDAVSHPGKFEHESPMVPILFQIILEGGGDLESYDNEASGYWAQRVGKWVITGDSQGFIEGYRFCSVAEAIASIERCHEADAERQRATQLLGEVFPE